MPRLEPAKGVALPMVLGVLGLAIANFTVRPIIAPVFALLASALLFVARFTSTYEESRDHPTVVRMALMGASIGIPLFIYGYAIGLWANSGMVPWVQALALLVTISLLATVTESGRLAGMLTAEVAMWSGVTWVTDLAGGIMSLIIGAVISVAAYLRQCEIDQKIRLAVEEGVRVQTRAEEILADYEETGQGWFWETDRRGLITYLSRPIAEALGPQDQLFLPRTSPQPLTL